MGHQSSKCPDHFSFVLVRESWIPEDLGFALYLYCDCSDEGCLMVSLFYIFDFL